MSAAGRTACISTAANMSAPPMCRRSRPTTGDRRGAAARRRQRPDPARRPHRRRMGRHAPHRHDLLVRQELHRAGRGACVRSRADFARRLGRRQRPDDGFASPHNRAITWRHLLQQTSEWQGTLWDKPDSVDHNRQVGLGNDNSRKGRCGRWNAPGTRFEYNDVRVNLLAFADAAACAGRCPRCCASGSWIRSARRTAGNGAAIATRRSSSTARRWSWCPAAAIGAADCSFPAAIMRALAS